LLCTYVTGVRAGDLSVRPLHLTDTDLTFAQLQRICRMQLGWHALASTTGRSTRMPRWQQVCKLCSSAGHGNAFGRLAVEDVAHYMVECPCLQHVRVWYPLLFLPDRLSAPDACALTRFELNHKDQRVLAQALQDLHSKGQAMLAGQPPQQPPPQQPATGVAMSQDASIR
jgi:hypothetical protein